MIGVYIDDWQLVRVVSRADARAPMAVSERAAQEPRLVQPIARSVSPKRWIRLSTISWNSRPGAQRSAAEWARWEHPSPLVSSFFFDPGDYPVWAGHAAYIGTVFDIFA